MKKLRVFEAFAGVGSQRMALRNLGIDHEVVGIAEIDKYALKSYEAIHGDCPNFGDISKIDPHNLPDMDLFTYSFPCVDLSNAGLQKGLVVGTRSGLLYECEKIIETKKPKYLLLENVKALVSKKFKGDFMKWLEYLESLGYTNYWDILNAKDYGVPQNRERVFVVSVLGKHNLYNIGVFEKENIAVQDILEMNVDEKFYLSDKMKKYIQSKDSKYIANEATSVLNRSVACTKTTREGNTRADASDYICEDLPHLQKVYNIPNISQYRVRKLTPLECWRLMGFSDEDFKKAKEAGISNSQLYKQAGNSIVVPVLEAIFDSLFEREG